MSPTIIIKPSKGERFEPRKVEVSPETLKKIGRSVAYDNVHNRKKDDEEKEEFRSVARTFLGLEDTT